MATPSGFTEQNTTSAIETDWTVQPFNEVAGQPWLALQERTTDGEVRRQLTGYRSELVEVASQLNVTPRELPPVSQAEFFAQHFQNSAHRDYELGRQFASDRSRGLPLQYAPVSLDHFIKGVEIRESEFAIRQQAAFRPDQSSTMDTSATSQTAELLAGKSPVLQQDVDRGTHLQANELVQTQRMKQQTPQQEQHETYSLGFSI